MARKRGNREGTIFKRADGRWPATVDLGWYGGKRRRKTVYGRTRAEVAERLTALLQQQADGVPFVAETKFVGEFLDEWLDAVAPSIRPRTWQRYEEYVRLHAKPALERVRLAQLAPQHLQRLYRDRLASGMSAQSVVHLHRVLHRALGHAVRWGLVVRNVSDLVDPPRPDRAEMRTLSPEEARRFLSLARADRLDALFVLAITTGLRQGELLGLRWREVDLDGRTLRVTGSLQRIPGQGPTIVEPKTPRSRRLVMLGEEAVEALWRHRSRQQEERLHAGSAWCDLDLVFANAVGSH